MSVLRLGELVEVAVFPPNEHTVWFPAVVRGFGARGGCVHVEAVDRSDDPMVENEFWLPFSQVRRPESREAPRWSQSITEPLVAQVTLSLPNGVPILELAPRAIQPGDVVTFEYPPAGITITVS